MNKFKIGDIAIVKYSDNYPVVILDVKDDQVHVTGLFLSWDLTRWHPADWLTDKNVNESVVDYMADLLFLNNCEEYPDDLGDFLEHKEQRYRELEKSWESRNGKQ